MFSAITTHSLFHSNPSWVSSLRRSIAAVITQPATPLSENHHHIKMFRGSPSYSPPGGKRRSPSYSPPRQRNFQPTSSRRTASRDSCDGVSPPRGDPIQSYRSPHLSRERSRSRSSVRPSYSRRRRSRSLRSRSGENRSRSRSKSTSRSTKINPTASYPWEDRESLRTLHCKDCNVYLQFALKS